MTSPTLNVGDTIEARCTKCRKNATHSIVQLKETRPAKVQCSLCDRVHVYRPPTSPKKARRTPTDPKVAERLEWQQLRPEMDEAKARAYSMDGRYRLNSLIDHPMFGLGLVQRLAGERKMEVLFADGRKTMRCL